MSAYAYVNCAFLALALVVFAVAALYGRIGRRTLGAFGVTLGALLVLTAIFDNVMIGAGLFTYSADTLDGPLVGLAPLGDFAYPVGAAVLLPATWLLLTGGPAPASTDRKDP
ncbi:hypothetical protein [Arthrobacter sp.]|uniref:hypothetical protein n=1 Tax=Arthrobacter sp. TaxID=1667 RepID=UPI003A8E62C1